MFSCEILVCGGLKGPASESGGRLSFVEDSLATLCLRLGPSPAMRSTTRPVGSTSSPKQALSEAVPFWQVQWANEELAAMVGELRRCPTESNYIEVLSSLDS